MAMPQWLQTILIILAVLLAVYLIAVLAQVILAKALRRQAEPMRTSIQRAQQEVAAARDKLDNLTPMINGGTKELPFGPLYDQARLLLKRGMTSVNEVQNQLAAITAQEIPEEPLSSSLRLMPMSKEVAQRVSTRRGVKTVSVHLTEVNDTLARINQLQIDIEALPQREKEALLQLQKRSAEAVALIESESRPKRPMIEERDVLTEADALLAQANKLLADAKPPQAAVIIAYPLRLKAHEQFQTLDRMITAAADKRTNAEAALARSDEHLNALTAAIAADKTAGFARPQFTAQANGLAERIAATQNMVEQGDYDMALGALAELDKDSLAQQTALAALNAERLRVTTLADNASRRLSTVTQWVAETPERFDLDVTRAAAQQLQEASDQLRSLIPLEDVAVMAAAIDLDRQVEDTFTRASNVRDDFVASERRFDDLSKTLNDPSVQTLVSQTTGVASELSKANRSYWGELTPEAITASAGELAEQWQILRGQLTQVQESELVEVLGRMEGVQAMFDRASVLHGEAVKALTQLDADRLQATTALNDDVMVKLLADAQTIGAQSPSLAEQPALITARVEELRGELQAPAPDFKTINANALRLRREAEGYVADYQQRLQQVRGQLGLLRYRLSETRDNLSGLNEDARIDFVPITESANERVNAWLSGYEAAAVAPLEAAQAILSEGEAAERDAAAQLSEATAIAKSVNDRLPPIKTAIAELNGTLSSAQAGLRAMADVGGERWGQVMLDPAREPLTEALEQLAKLEQPPQKLSPEAAQAAAGRIESLVINARVQAMESHADIARRVAEVQEKRDELSRALSDGEAAAAADANLQDDWQLVRQQVAGLELRWTNATSYAEAVEALTQAVQRAQRFVQGVRT